MHDPFNGYAYLSHLRRRWPVAAGVPLVGLAVSLLVSFLMPTKYTATVSLVVEPPAGGDPRAATVVSPIYLESLRTYAHFASSDRVFADAVEHFHLRDGSKPIESLKRSILGVKMPRNTKVLEISVTLGDPRQAHGLALHIAEATVELNRKTNLEGTAELLAGLRRELDEATVRLRAAEAEYVELRRQSPSAESLKARLDELSKIRTEVSSLALMNEAVADDQERRRKIQPAAERPDSSEMENGSRLEGLMSRSARFRREEASLAREAISVGDDLARRSAVLDNATSRLAAARAVREQAEKRLLDLQSMDGFRGERIVLVDPGVVPERPSSPNIPLNILVAVLLGVITAFIYLTLEYSFQSQKLAAAHEDETVWIRARS